MHYVLNQILIITMPQTQKPTPTRQTNIDTLLTLIRSQQHLPEVYP